MNSHLIKSVIIFSSILISNSYFSNKTKIQHNDSLVTKKKRHAIVIEGLGKSWGASLSYEYNFNSNFSGGIGYCWCPAFVVTNKHIGVVYGIMRSNKGRNHFVTSVGVIFNNELISPNIGIGYELESDHIYFRVIPSAILGMYEDYPILPSIGLHFGLRI